jgi:hypothetical protein
MLGHQPFVRAAITLALAPHSSMPNTTATPTPNHLARLQDAIRRLNGCESRYLETVSVSESVSGFKGNTAWQGEVAVFEIYGHTQAKRAYAWSSTLPNKETRYVVVLEVPPIKCPRTAVQAALAAQIVNRTLR